MSGRVPIKTRSPGCRHERKYVLWCALASLGALFPWLGGADVPADGRLPFTEAEIRAILSHGPWPVPGKNDPTNRASGKREAIEFGERLFFDTRLSGTGRFSCGTCHVPERNWTDNQTRGVAVAQMDRNTPTLMNVRLGHSFGWDGGSDSLWSQSIRPMLDPRELGSSARQIAELVRNDEQFSCRYRKTFGSPPSATDDDAVLVGIGKALAAFQETLDSAPTPFDKFRDALARGERITPWSYSEAAQRGLRIFIGKGACNTCHTGPNFTNGEFHDNGFSRFDAPGRPIRDGSRGSSACGRAASICWGRTTTTRRARPRLLRAASKRGRAISTRSRCPRCATCCSPRLTATTARSCRSPTSCGTTRI